jgi:hypothetical protein
MHGLQLRGANPGAALDRFRALAHPLILRRPIEPSVMVDDFLNRCLDRVTH